MLMMIGFVYDNDRFVYRRGVLAHLEALVRLRVRHFTHFRHGDAGGLWRWNSFSTPLKCRIRAFEYRNMRYVQVWTFAKSLASGQVYSFQCRCCRKRNEAGLQPVNFGWRNRRLG